MFNRSHWRLLTASSLVLFGIVAVASPPQRVSVFDPKTLRPTDQGDLYTVQNGKPARRLTWWGRNFAPVTSRNGRLGVYRSLVRGADNWFGDHFDEVNLYLLNLETLNLRQLTTKGALRSNAVWSADSGAFAWLENNSTATQSSNRLMLYTVARQGAQMVLDGFPSNGGVGGANSFYLDWTPRGILLASDPSDTQTNVECALVAAVRATPVRRATIAKLKLEFSDTRTDSAFRNAILAACAKQF